MIVATVEMSLLPALPPPEHRKPLEGASEDCCGAQGCPFENASYFTGSAPGRQSAAGCWGRAAPALGDTRASNLGATILPCDNGSEGQEGRGHAFSEACSWQAPGPLPQGF